MEMNSDGNNLSEKCNTEYVPLYRSENGTESEQSENCEKLPKKRGRKPKPKVKEKKPKKLRGKGHNWLFVKKFKNSEEAEEAVRLENSWSVISNRHSEEGRKQVYRCNKVKTRGPQCVAQILLLYDAYSDDVVLFRKEFEHDHHLLGIRAGSHGIDPETKRNINALFDLHITKPRVVFNHLMEKTGLKMPTMMQLNNYLNDLRRRKYGCAANVSKLKKWITGHTEVPENDHDAFVISYCVQESSTKVCYVLSTKKLLELASRSSIIHAEAICGLNWQGFQIVNAGTSGMDGKFYPLCLAVSSTDTGEVFKTLFNGLKDAITSMYTCFFEPSVLICDDEAIGDAFTSVFGLTPLVRTCWSHVKNEIKSAMEQIDETKQSLILEDIGLLHSATSREDFNKAAELFLLKWEEEQNFTSYFREEWLVRHSNWFLGSTNSLTTNDSLEAVNKKIRDSKIIHERLPAKRFLITTCEIVTEWSNNNLDSFTSKYIVDLNDWAEAFHWLKLDRKTTILCSDDNKTTYLVQSSKIPPISRTTYLQSSSSWKTFDEYKEIYFSHWKVTMVKEPQIWTDSRCSCPQFATERMCKHVLGLAVQLKYVTIPAEATKMTPVKKHIKVKEENSTDSPQSSQSSQNKPKKVYTLAGERKQDDKKDVETENTKKNQRKSKLQSELQSALQKEKFTSKRNSTASWSELNDSDTKTPPVKRKNITGKAKTSKHKKKRARKKCISTSSEQNQDDLWSEQEDWIPDDSSRDWDESSINIDSTNNSNKLKCGSKKKISNSHMELRTDSSRNLKNSINDSNNTRQEDEFYFFGQSIAAQLRRLPINVALDLQVQFQNDLTKARMKSINISENVVHSSTCVERNPLEGYEVTVILPNKTELDDSD